MGDPFPGRDSCEAASRGKETRCQRMPESRRLEKTVPGKLIILRPRENRKKAISTAMQRDIAPESSETSLAEKKRARSRDRLLSSPSSGPGSLKDRTSLRSGGFDRRVSNPIPRTRTIIVRLPPETRPVPESPASGSVGRCQPAHPGAHCRKRRAAHRAFHRRPPRRCESRRPGRRNRPSA